jgi:hypothetical protein
VNSRQEEFSGDILRLLSLPPGVNAKLRWVSPLAEDGFSEYQDTEFLEKLELDQYSSCLKERFKEFWPRGGPCWDALAIVQGTNPHGALLIEAKSHFSELHGACKARRDSHKKIGVALLQTARYLHMEMNSSWTDNYYQMANRYAHLYFLREIAKIPAWLVNVYFINDQTIKHVETSPHSADEWREKLNEVKKRMGLGTKSVPFTADLFVEAIVNQPTPITTI